MNRTMCTLLLVACALMLPMAALAQLPSPSHGWNMGNTLEPPCGEGCWGGTASQNLINAVAAAGFNTVRIPCAWDSHANTRTYQIDPAYMARVKQVVDWCIAKNLYVIINCHWDNGWLDSSGFRRFDSKINGKVQTYWSQISSTFKTYDSHLLFACTNEPDIDSQAKTNVLFQYYQTFVNAVRATGGNNTTRWLILQGPSADIDKAYSYVLPMPTDPTPGRLMLECHYYSPYQFCLMTSDATWGNMFYFWGQGYHSVTMPSRNANWGEEAYMAEELDKLKTKFVSAGIPVLIGEWRAEPKSGNPDLTGAYWNLHYASVTYWNKTMHDYINARGMYGTCWDTPGQIFDWTTGAILDQTQIDSLLGRSCLPNPGGGI